MRIRNRSVLAVVLPLILMSSLVLFTGYSGGFFDCGMFYPDPPLPEITYGEFPFRIEYEIDDERFIVEDTVICEFDGIYSSEAGKSLRWKSHLASGSEGSGLILYVVDDKKTVTCNVGQPQYYMGCSLMTPDEYWHYSLKAFLVEGQGTPGVIALFPEQWYDDYNFRFISWEFSDPIVNTFK